MEAVCHVVEQEIDVDEVVLQLRLQLLRIAPFLQLRRGLRARVERSKGFQLVA